MHIQRNSTGDDRADELIHALSELCPADNCRDKFQEILTTVVKLGLQYSDRGDFKLINTTLKELRHAFRVFLPHRHKRKVVIFGSARTPTNDPCYQMAQKLSERMVDNGYHIMTGAGPGIMEAANRGANPECSFGLNIKLPFEQTANPYIVDNPNLMYFKYFFTRKLVFIKESDATVLLPGGFGTLDEGYENLTLIQTGKTLPRPVVFLEPEQGEYWKTWREHVQKDLLGGGYISTEDINLLYFTHSVDEAVRYILDFYRIYHSLRYVGDQTVLRLNRELPQDFVNQVNDQYSDILRKGRIEKSSALPAEIRDSELVELPRLVLHFNKRNFGRLIDMIRFINRYPG